MANGEFSPHTLEFMIDPAIVASVTFRCKDGIAWNIEHLGRLIMALEMQRSFLLGAPVAAVNKWRAKQKGKAK